MTVPTEVMPPADAPPERSDAGPGGDDPRRLLIMLAVVALLAVGVADLLHLLSVLAVVAVIAGVVMLHEAGHFVAAKLGGMKVTEYFLGFGPRLWSFRRGETEYGVKALPLGGYVRIVGMHNLDQVDPPDEPRTYRQQSFARRFAVAVAGSSVHFVLAIVAAWSLLAFAGQAKARPVIASIPPITTVTPAQRAGFDAGDEIVAFDGQATHGQWGPVHAYIQDHVGKPISFTVLRHRGGTSQTLVLVATPADATTILDHGQPVSTDHVGFLGISVAGANYSLLGSVPHAFSTFWHAGILDAFHSIGAIFSPHGLSSIGHQVVSKPGAAPADQNVARPASVVGIVRIADQLHGWANEVWLFMIANAFVGLINLFPILPFDGGHVVIAIYERLRSRRGRRYFADINKMLPYSFVVVVLIGFVFLSSVYLDIAHPITLR